MKLLDITRTKKQPPQNRLQRYHKYLRKNNRLEIVFWITYLIVVPFILLFFRIKKNGGEYIPQRGKVILAANHKSFFDPFFIALLKRRKMFFIAKAELFVNPIVGALLVRLGAIPIRRGEADQQALETAQKLLDQGEMVGVFPEGTRSDGSAKPRKGAIRLAQQTDSPIVPIGISGTEKNKTRFRHRISLKARKPVVVNEISSQTNQEIWEEINKAVDEAENL